MEDGVYLVDSGFKSLTVHDFKLSVDRHGPYVEPDAFHKFNCTYVKEKFLILCRCEGIRYEFLGSKEHFDTITEPSGFEILACWAIVIWVLEMRVGVSKHDLDVQGSMRYDLLVDFFGVFITQVLVFVIEYTYSDVLIVLLVHITGLNLAKGFALNNELDED